MQWSDMGLSARAQFTPRGDLGRFVDVQIAPGVKASVEAACKTIEGRAKELVPVDTGALRDSITTEVNETGKTVVGTVSSDLPYAVFTEYGTGRRGEASPGAGAGPYNPNWPGMPATPWLRPAVDENREAIKDLFRANISLSL